MATNGQRINRLPRSAFMSLADWIRAKQADHPLFGTSADAAAAVQRELGFMVSPTTFRNIAKTCGVDLSRLVRHHGVGDGNSHRSRKGAASPDVAERLARIEAMLSALCTNLGVKADA